MLSASHLRSLPLSSSLLRLCFLSLDLLLLLVLRFELLCRSLDLDLLLAILPSAVPLWQRIVMGAESARSPLNELLTLTGMKDREDGGPCVWLALTHRLRIP